MQADKRVRRVLTGSPYNIRFDELVAIAELYGFELVRRRGSHTAFWHPGVPQLLVLQPEGRQAKAYQVRQLRQLVRAYNLRRGDDHV